MNIESLVPIGISALALLVSGVSLGWTIFRDVRKPKFKVRVHISRIATFGAPPSDPFVSLEVVNHGPVPNRVVLPQLARSRWDRWVKRVEWSHAVVIPDDTHPATTPSPKRNALLDVGEQISFAFPINNDSFIAKDVYARVGVSDGFGRVHYAPKKQLRKLQERYKKEFA